MESPKPPDSLPSTTIAASLLQLMVSADSIAPSCRGGIKLGRRLQRFVALLPLITSMQESNFNHTQRTLRGQDHY